MACCSSTALSLQQGKASLSMLAPKTQAREALCPSGHDQRGTHVQRFSTIRHWQTSRKDAALSRERMHTDTAQYRGSISHAGSRRASAFFTVWNAGPVHANPWRRFLGQSGRPGRSQNRRAPLPRALAGGQERVVDVHRQRRAVAPHERAHAASAPRHSPFMLRARMQQALSILQVLHDCFARVCGSLRHAKR